MAHMWLVAPGWAALKAEVTEMHASGATVTSLEKRLFGFHGGVMVSRRVQLGRPA